jgi:hypothetical protein
LGVSATYRLQFLGASAWRGSPVLAETSLAAASIEAAIGHATEVGWPPGAHALRLVDLDGREVYQRHRDHVRRSPGGS